METPERRSLAKMVAYAVLSRAVLWVIGYYAERYGHARAFYRVLPAYSHSVGISGWWRWDVGWYVSIVNEGYSYFPNRESNVAFLPGFPLVIAACRRFFGNTFTTGMFVANASFVAAVIALWGWVRERAGLKAAERAVVLLLVYPLSFFMNTIYAEALFFFACTSALRSADRGRWAEAGVYGFVASLTRPMGIFLVPAFACVLAKPLREGRAPWRGLLALSLPILGLGLFALYLWKAYGSPFVMLWAQHGGWHVGSGLSLPSLRVRTDPYTELLDVFQLFLPFLLFWLSVRAWKRLGAMSGAYAVGVSIFGILLGGPSLGREALAVVPAFAAAGLEDPGPVATVGLRACAFAMLLVFAYAFVCGRFMG